MKTALIAGATGLIGKQLVQLLLHDSYYTKVKAISRKPIGIEHPKLENIVTDFDQLEQLTGQLQADDVYCCLGTTIKIAKTKEAFRKVDYDYPVLLGEIAKVNGATQYLLVSALGSDKKSNIFYNRVKGEVEEAIRSLGFKSYHIFRPSLLLGERTEERTGEGAATTFFKIFGFLVPLKWKAIDSGKVAHAMFRIAQQNKAGYHVHESVEMQQY